MTNLASDGGAHWQGDLERGRLHPAGQPLPRPGRGSLRRSVPGRAKALSPVRLARLPVGAPDHHRAHAQGARGCDRDVDRRSHPRRAGVGAPRPCRVRPAISPAMASASCPRPTRHLTRVRRPHHGSRPVGPRTRTDRQQRVRRHHPDVGHRLERLGPPARARALSRALRAQIDSLAAQIYDDVNNGVYKARIRHHAGGVRGSRDSLVRQPRRARSAARPTRFLLGDRQTLVDWRLFTTLVRFDAVYHGHFKCNVRRIVDYKYLFPYLRDLYQTAGRGGHGGLRPHQAPLLHDPPLDQPERHRARRSRPGSDGAAWARAELPASGMTNRG